MTVCGRRAAAVTVPSPGREGRHGGCQAGASSPPESPCTISRRVIRTWPCANSPAHRRRGIEGVPPVPCEGPARSPPPPGPGVLAPTNRSPVAPAQHGMPQRPVACSPIAVTIRVLGSTISGMEVHTVIFARASSAAAKGVQMMNVMQNLGIVRHWRDGVCHRCGWRGPVGKISRRSRHRLKPVVNFGRLCDDCVTTFLHGRTVVSHPHWGRRPEPKHERRRQVA
jgi:hypothetical protein